MLRWVLGAMGACAMLAPATAFAQVPPAADEVAAEGSSIEARPLGNQAEWVTYDDYPREALRDNVSGATWVRLDLDEQGVPARCTITESSGSELLDTATCAKLMERARFHPVLNSEGLPAPGTFETSVRWAAPEPTPDPLATTPQPMDTRLWVSLPNLQFDPAIQVDRTAMYDLRVDGTGGVTDCTVTRGSGDEQFDKSLCDQLKVNAAFEVSNSGPGLFSGSYSIPDHLLRAFPAVGRSHPRTRNYAVRVFIEEDGSVSDCQWIGRNAPAVDPWPVCNRSSWVDQRNLDGKLVRGVTQLAVSQRQLEELAIPRDDPTNPANRGLTIVFRDDGSVSDCRWSGANPPALDPLPACNYVAESMRKHTGLAALMRGTQNVRLDEHEVAALQAAQSGARVAD